MSTPRSLTWSSDSRRTALAIDAPHASMAVLEHPANGSTRGTVLLVHGFSGSKEDFAELLPHLAERGWHSLAIDLPGQHESDPHPAPSAQSLAATLSAGMAAAASRTGGTDVHLVGHSLGGVIARRTVIQSPHQAASLTLLCSGPAALTSPDHREPLERFERAMSLGMVDAVWEHMRIAQRQARPDISDDILDFLERRLRRGHAATHSALARILLTEPDLTSDLADAGVPVHVLHGADDDVWTPSEQKHMADRLGAACTAIPGAGHSPAVDDPAATATALDAWWTSLVPAGRS